MTGHQLRHVEWVLQRRHKLTCTGALGRDVHMNWYMYIDNGRHGGMTATAMMFLVVLVFKMTINTKENSVICQKYPTNINMRPTINGQMVGTMDGIGIGIVVYFILLLFWAGEGAGRGEDGHACIWQRTHVHGDIWLQGSMGLCSSGILIHMQRCSHVGTTWVHARNHYMLPCILVTLKLLVL